MGQSRSTSSLASGAALSVQRYRGRWKAAKTEHRLLSKLSIGNTSSPHTKESHRSLSISFGGSSESWSSPGEGKEWKKRGGEKKNH